MKWAIAGPLLLLLFMAGVGLILAVFPPAPADAGRQDEFRLHLERVRLPNGNVATCIIYRPSWNAATMDCDLDR